MEFRLIKKINTKLIIKLIEFNRFYILPSSYKSYTTLKQNEKERKYYKSYYYSFEWLFFRYEFVYFTRKINF